MPWFLGISMYLHANDSNNSNFEIKKQTNSGLEKRIGTFFEKLEKEQTSEAFDHLLENSTIGRKKIMLRIWLKKPKKH